MDIDWKRVNEKLYCPICGAKAYIAPETDGTEGTHTHRFPVSRDFARMLSLPDTSEIINKFDGLIENVQQREDCDMILLVFKQRLGMKK